MGLYTGGEKALWYFREKEKGKDRHAKGKHRGQRGKKSI